VRAAIERIAGLPRRGYPTQGEPLARVASIHREDAPGRVALLSAIHPITGDQLLTTSEWEPNDLGYGEPELLGYLDALAPVTGSLELRRRDVPWASHFGRRVRG
jgi:hypothetical protein